MRKTKLIVFLILPSSFILSALAGSATWNLNPTSTQWINPANWTPAVVPNGPLDTATFDISGKTAVSLTATTTELDSIIFNPSASAFTITLVPDVDSNPALIVSGAGVSNQSGFEQNLVAGTSGFQVSTINFINSASAGTDVTYTLASNRAPGAAQSNLIQFFDDSTAESATFVIEPPHRQGAAGQMSFGGNATAASATFFNSLGFLGFYGNATAADAVINDDTCFLTFSENSTAGNAVVNQRNANITFSGAATAGNGTFTLHDSGVFFGGDGGNALFTLKASSAQFSSGTAGNAIFVLDGGMGSAMVGSVAFFNFASSGGNATFNLEGGQVSDAPGAIISFFGQRGYTGPSAARFCHHTKQRTGK